MEENLQELEATYGAPASLFERSAAARAKASGSTTEEVVAQWVAQIDGAAPSSVPPAEGRGDAEERSDEAGGSAAAEAADGGSQTPAAAAGALSGAALLAAVAEARGMPESLIERSAKARASASGGSVDAVLQEWAQEEGIGVAAPSSVPPAEGRGDAEERSDDAGGPATAEAEGRGDAEERSDDAGGSVAAPAAGLSGPALLTAVAEARGMPESLVQRSALARAKTAGVEVDEVLLEWAQEEGIAGAEPSSVPPAEGRGDAEERSDDAGGSVAAPAAGLSGPALLTAVAEARGMPESLVQRSALARAKTAGVEVDEVLLEWAHEEGIAGAEPSSVPPTEGRGDAEERSDDAGGSVAAPAAGVVSGAALLSAVAAVRKMPESLVERSAKARAKSAGGSVDDVLLEWAQEEGIDVGGAEPSSVPPTEGRGDAEERSDDAGGSATAQPEDIEELVAASDVGPAPKAEIPGPVEPEPIEEPEPEVPASPRVRYPAWLAAMLVIIPLLAVLYVVVVPNQPSCGSAGQLAIDPATGNAVGCDGGQYGMDAVGNLSAGAAIYDASCAVCHGANGGGGAGPAMAGGAVLETFPAQACTSQIEWIALGSDNWPDATYGASETPVAGGMPGFDGQLTELEIAQVTLHERVEFGGLDVETAETACGLGIEEG